MLLASSSEIVISQTQSFHISKDNSYAIDKFDNIKEQDNLTTYDISTNEVIQLKPAKFVTTKHCYKRRTAANARPFPTRILRIAGIYNNAYNCF